MPFFGWNHRFNTRINTAMPKLLRISLLLLLPALAHGEESMSLAEKLGRTAGQVSGFFHQTYEKTRNALTSTATESEISLQQTRNQLGRVQDQVIYDLRDSYYAAEYDLRKGYRGE